MSQRIQIRRGLEAERRTVIFNDGEPVWITDRKKFYVGDGVTSGGIGLIVNPPPTSTSTGVSGQIAIGQHYLYGCTGTSKWGRVALSNW